MRDLGVPLVALAVSCGKLGQAKVRDLQYSSAIFLAWIAEPQDILGLDVTVAAEQLLDSVAILSVLGLDCSRLRFALFEPGALLDDPRFIAMDLNKGISDPTALLSQPVDYFVAWFWFWILLPVALEMGLGPWEDQIELSELLVRCEQRDQMFVGIATELHERIGLPFELVSVPRQKTLDREFSLMSLKAFVSLYEEANSSHVQGTYTGLI